MYAVVMSYQKNDVEDKVMYNIVSADHLANLISEDTEISFRDGKWHGDVAFYKTKKEAEKAVFPEEK